MLAGLVSTKDLSWKGRAPLKNLFCAKTKTLPPGELRFGRWGFAFRIPWSPPPGGNGFPKNFGVGPKKCVGSRSGVCSGAEGSILSRIGSRTGLNIGPGSRVLRGCGSRVAKKFRAAVSRSSQKTSGKCFLPSKTGMFLPSGSRAVD